MFGLAASAGEHPGGFLVLERQRRVMVVNKTFASAFKISSATS